MDVSALPLAARHLEHLRERGIETLYPPQTAAVEAGVCVGESVVAAVPTASGKTLIAQLAALTADGPTVYVVPLRALATEKAETFEAVPGVSVGVASGDFDATDEELAGHDVVVATAEKVDAAIRHGADWAERIGCAVLDEVHLLDEPGRGPTLEVTIAKLRRLNPEVQLVALSATVPNAEEIADWLDATVVRSDWRPVELRTGIYADGTLVLGDGEDREERPIDLDEELPIDRGQDAQSEPDLDERNPGGESGRSEKSEGSGRSEKSEGSEESGKSGPSDDLSPTGALVRDALADGGQCLVFVSSRRDARQLATTLAGALDVEAHRAEGDAGTGRAEGDGETHRTAGDVEVVDGGTASDPTGSTPDGPGGGARSSTATALREAAATMTGESLADVAESGIAFHHAGLTAEHRSLVESGFRSGELRVLCATPTLAAGVNVPARRVIVRDHERYGDSGYEPLSPLEVRQMFGRAGRPGLDPYGEAILVADDGDDREDLRERYLDADPDPVTSKLDDPRALRPHVLASVAGGVADSRVQLADLLGETFCAYCGDGDGLQATAADAIDRLIDAGMLVDDAERDVRRNSDRYATAESGDERDAIPESGGERGTNAERTGEQLVATELGALVSRVYVDPATGADVVAALERAEDLDRITPLTVCEIICDTAEMPTRYVGQAEAGELSEFAMRKEDELARPIREFEGDFHAWLAALKTARLLADYAEGAPLDRIVDGYNVGPGDVRRFAERAEWLLAATESLAEHVDSDATERIRDTRERLAERND